MGTKLERRQKIRYAVRKKVSGTAQKPRLSVFRSNAEIYAQLIDDANGQTLASASSRDKDIAAQKVTKLEKSKLVGEAIARKAKELGLTNWSVSISHSMSHVVAVVTMIGGLTRLML